MEDFRQQLGSRVLLADGAMGTYLSEKGIPENENKSLQSLLHPDLVKGIYREYIEAGADIIRTNTFDANPFKLRDNKKRLQEILHESVRLAKETREQAANRSVYIAGSVGPLGVMLRPYGIYSFQEMSEMFQSIVGSLIDTGVDLIVFETFTSSLEIKAAISAMKKISQLPVVGSMTFNADGISQMGDEIQKAMLDIESAGVDAVGLNCYLGPKDSYEVSRPLVDRVNRPLSIMPNAGIPTVVNDRTFYLSNPEYFKEYAGIFIRNGVQIIGSCCGTTPAHTARMKEVVDSEGSALKMRISRSATAREPASIPGGLKDKLGREPVITVEATPPRSINCDRAVRSLKSLKKLGIDAINITENPLARIRMNPAAFSRIVMERVGLEPILHFTLRDRNLLAIQSDLLGAYALGIQTIFAIRGDPAIMGDFPKATTVFDVDTLELIRIIKALNSGQDISGKKMKSTTGFFIGAAANPANPDLDAEISRVSQKVEAGADYLITQPVFDLKVFERFLAGVESFRVPVIAGLMEIKDERYAMFLNNEVPGFSIPERMMKTLSAGRQSGVEMAVDSGRELRGMADGIYLVSSSRKTAVIRDIVAGIIA